MISPFCEKCELYVCRCHEPDWYQKSGEEKEAVIESTFDHETREELDRVRARNSVAESNFQILLPFAGHKSDCGGDWKYACACGYIQALASLNVKEKPTTKSGHITTKSGSSIEKHLELVVRAESLANSATEGPWCANDGYEATCGMDCSPNGCMGHESGAREIIGPAPADGDYSSLTTDLEADAIFIAESRELVPQLTATIRELIEINKSLQEKIK